MRRVFSCSCGMMPQSASRYAVVARRCLTTDGVTLNEFDTRRDFTRFCLEQHASPLTGVPMSTFVAYIEGVRRSGSTTESQIRDMACFAFTGARVSLRQADEGSSAGVYDDDLRRFARTLPAAGISGDEAKAQLQKTLPSFAPKVMGCMTYRDVFMRLNHLFTVTRGADDTWVVKPTHDVLAQQQQQNTAATGAAASASQNTAASPLVESIDAALSTAYAAHCSRRGHKPGDWVDIEPLLRTLPAELAAQVTDWRSLVPQLKTFESSATLLARPRRKVRGAHVFVDGDGLTMAHVDVMMARLAVNLTTSTATVVRQAAGAALTGEDVVAPMDIPTYMAVEAAADKLRRAHPLVLKDVVYMCSEAKVDLYQKHVARAVAFPDAEVWVVSPSQELCISTWRAQLPGIPSTTEATA